MEEKNLNEYELKYKYEINIDTRIETLTEIDGELRIEKKFGTFLFDFLSIDVNVVEIILLKYGIFKSWGDDGIRYFMNMRNTLDEVKEDIYTLIKDIISIKNNEPMHLYFMTKELNSLIEFHFNEYLPQYPEYDEFRNNIHESVYLRHYLTSDLILSAFINDYKSIYSLIEKYINEPLYHDTGFINFLINQGIISSPYENMSIEILHDNGSLDELEELYKKNISYDNQYTYFVYDMSEVYDLTLYHIITSNMTVNKCMNCGKYFFPQTRDDEIYCNNIFKNNKTCKQLGYEIKANQDEILKPYRIIYKTQNARKQRNKHKTNIDDRFSKWSEYAHSVLKECQDGEITIEEMKELISGTEWLNDNVGDSNG